MVMTDELDLLAGNVTLAPGVRWLRTLVVALSACLAKARRVKGPGPDHFGNISRAASALQKEMGLDRPGGSAFRISGKK